MIDAPVATSTPGVSAFDPRVISWQYKAICAVRQEYDYSRGVHEVLLSGSIGSAKSIWMAHVVVTHCLNYPGAGVCLGRRALPDLKDTIFKKVCEHLDNDEQLTRGLHYEYTTHPAAITFFNGSKVICRSWADKNYEKFRSLELSMGVIEELTENDDPTFYKEFRSRIGRLPHVKENLMICATNPGDPEHWAHDYWELDLEKPSNPTRHVFYSLTEDNPFLPDWYITQLYDMYDEKEAQRMLKGRWLPIKGDVIYHAYDPQHNFRDVKYKVDKRYPISLNFDFNIALGKPMSCVLDQYIRHVYHFFHECIIHGSRTADIMDELAARELFELDVDWLVHGDATGKSRDTRSISTDYDIIFEFLSNYKKKDGKKIRFNLDDDDLPHVGDCVPAANPGVRERHNRMNGMIKNSRGRRRLFVYADCPILNKGFKLTKLRDGAQYIEDDSKEYQHCTTAAGYRVVYNEDMRTSMQGTGTQEL